MTGAEEHGDRLVGSTLAESYAILRVVGEGGMGRVYEARHTRIPTRRFAIKTLHAEYLRKPEALARFRREAEATASIDSPHVVGVYDVGRTADGQPYLVSEYLHGSDLGAHLGRVGKLAVAPMVRIVRQICRGVAAAHDRGIVHRDLKPENVFLVGDVERPEVKVVDFGISRIDDGGTQLTRTGMIMGTPAYMAPEQARGSAVDGRADIYAVGAILYRGLTGKEPFDKPEPSATLAAVLLEEPVAPRSIEPSIPEALELVLQRAMAKDPEVRFADIGQLDEALAPYDKRDPSPIVSGVRTMPSARVTTLGGGADDVRFARSSLVILGALGACAGLLAIYAAVGGTVAWLRGDASATLSPTESGVALLGIVSAALTPAILVIRHLLRAVWSSTMKVIALLGTLRVALVAALVSYGLAALVVRIVETVLLRRPLGSAWPLWDPLLVATAVAAAIVALRWQKSGSELPTPVRGGAALAVALTGIVLVSGLRGGDATAAAPQDAATEASVGAPAPAMRAPAEELVSARALGASGLAELSKRYPLDAALLGELLQSQRQAGAQAEALATAKRLLALDPSAGMDPEVRAALIDLAQGPLEISAQTLGLLESDLGAEGLDILYAMLHDERVAAPVRAHIDARLGEAEVRSRATPALRIAYDLSKADKCEEAVALLDRAAKDGDERSLVELERFRGSIRCGFLGIRTCTRCARQKDEIERAVAALSARGRGR